MKPAAPAKLRDVAREAEVSQGTASNVFNRPHLVREEVRERVMKAADRLGYAGPSVNGRLLRAGRVNAVGIAAIEPLSYFFDDPWARNMLSEISKVCDKQGTGIALVSAISDERVDWNIQSAVVDGFILLCVEGGERLVEITQTRKVPYVALAIGTEDSSIPAIGVDNIGGAKLAAEHLLALGHSHFCILSTQVDEQRVGRVTQAEMSNARYSTTRDRARGYWEALRSAGISTAETPIFATLEDEQSTHKGLAEIFSDQDHPTAILAMSDKIAIWAIAWLTGHGFDVPGDVSIVGFDGVPESATVTPRLTTVIQPAAEIARLAVQAVLGDAFLGRHVMQGTLDVRDSTAPPRG